MPAIMASFKKFNDEFMAQYDDHRGYSRMWAVLQILQIVSYSSAIASHLQYAPWAACIWL